MPAMILVRSNHLLLRRVERVFATTLGNNVSDEKLQNIFKRLEFQVKAENEKYTITLPSFRTTKDIEYEACIIEEVGRVIGYDNITPVSHLNLILRQQD